MGVRNQAKKNLKPPQGLLFCFVSFFFHMYFFSDYQTKKDREINFPQVKTPAQGCLSNCPNLKLPLVKEDAP